MRREVLAAAARDRQAIDKLKERQKAEHDAEWARKSQNTLGRARARRSPTWRGPRRMSIEAVISRVSQLQAMLAPGARSRRRPATPSTDQLLDRAPERDAPAARQRRLARRRRPPPPPRARPPPARAFPPARPTPPRSPPPRPRNGVDPALLAGLIKQESGFNPNAGSGAGARGLDPADAGTAAGLGVTNVLDPVAVAQRRREVPQAAARRLRRRRHQGARGLQRRPRRGAALRRRAALRRDPELRPHRAGQRRGLPRRHLRLRPPPPSPPPPRSRGP